MPKFMNQPSFGDHSIISHTSHNQFMDLQPSLVSFANKNHDIIQQSLAHSLTKKSENTATLITKFPTIASKIGENITKIVSSLLPVFPKLKTLCK